MNNNNEAHGFIPCGVIHGDCLEILPTLPGECIDAVITDPPCLGRYKDRTGRTLANDDKPSAVVGVYAELFRVDTQAEFVLCHLYGYPKLGSIRSGTSYGRRPTSQARALHGCGMISIPAGERATDKTD